MALTEPVATGWKSSAWREVLQGISACHHAKSLLQVTEKLQLR